ncbi:MAG: transporter [Flavobacteriales bacterium CG03_land_8_20_14_0_80_35_15]|nr:MAG: transporter [Flavobacteriales bacterium CG03_land_8_20_14_0_80_35_15]
MKKIILVIGALTYFWQAFPQEKPLQFSLDEAVTYALSHSYTIKNAKLAIDAAKKKKWETTTIGLPQVSATVDYQNFLKQVVTLLPAEIFGGTPGTFNEVTFGTKQNLHTTITMNQLLFDGSYLIGLQSAKVYLQISELAEQKTERSIKEAVINAYGNTLLAEESVKILEQNLGLLEKNLNDTKAIVKNGLAEEQDAEQLQITLSTIKNQLNKTKRLSAISYKMLNITLGIDIDAPVILTDKLENLAIKNSDLNLMNQNFDLANHIDYKIVDNTKKSNELLMKFEMSKALPSISTFVNYSKFANSDSFTFLTKDQTWLGSSLLGVNINVPIFSSFRRSSRTQQAKIALEQSKIDLQQTSEELKLQVASAKSDYQFSLDQYVTAKENLNLSERIEHKENLKFFEGVGSSFELTAAQNQLYQKQQDYLQSILSIINAKIKLENALNLK